jgi:hypothetical protein
VRKNEGWTKAQLVSYLRGLPTLGENPDSIDASATRRTIINEILATTTASLTPPTNLSVVAQ